MKMKMKNLFMLLMVVLFAVSCTTIDTGHEAPIVSWGGKTNMERTLNEGVHYGLNYLWDKTPEYDVREQTVTYDVTLNDKNDMETPVSVVVYFKPISGKTNYLHSLVGKDYVDAKLTPFISSAVGKVIPQYSAQEINKFSREQVERDIVNILKDNASAIYVEIIRVNFTKVTIPRTVAKLAEQTAEQIAKNELASKKEEEQVNLAKARVAAAQGEYEAAQLEAKTRDILSQPKMLEMQRIDNERIMWEGYAKTGKSPFGENNIFGEVPMIIKNK